MQKVWDRSDQELKQLRMEKFSDGDSKELEKICKKI